MAILLGYQVCLFTEDHPNPEELEKKFSDNLGDWGHELKGEGLHTVWLMRTGNNFYILMTFVSEGQAVSAQMNIEFYINLFAEITAPITPTLMLTGAALPASWKMRVKYKVR